MNDLFQNVNGQIVPRDVCARKHGGNEQSVSAFDYVMNTLTDRQARILLEIKARPAGATLDELAIHFRTNPNAISGRITDLKIKGRIERRGTRKTRSGCSAAVWVAK